MPMDLIRDSTDKTKIAIMTGSYITEAMYRQIREGADVFIEKPFELSPIREVLNDTLIRKTPSRGKHVSLLFQISFLCQGM